MKTVEQSTPVPASDGQAPDAAARPGRLRRIPLPRLRLTTSERRLMLMVVDVLVLNSALLVALVLRYGYRFSWATLFQAPIYFVLLTVLWLVWASFFDCYDLPSTAKASQSVWNTGRAAALTALIYLAIPFYTPHFPASRASAYLFVALATASVPAWRALYATVFSQPNFQQRLLIVGAGNSGSELARELAHVPHSGNPHSGSGYQVVGFVDDDPAKAGTTIEGAPVMGNRYDLGRLAREHQVDTLVVAITHTPQIHPTLFQALLDCQETGFRLEPMTNLYERLTGRVPVEHAGRNLHVILPLNDSPMHRVFLALKRLVDLFAAVVGLVLLAFLAPVVAFGNLFWARGPLLYHQTRVGKGGRPFELVKFRSMIPGAEEDCGAVWAREDDDRITPVGNVLRRTRLDELPQVWNILKGQMSLIGPRPERPEFVTDLVRQVPFYQARHAVRPGITGWAQVRYRYGGSVEDTLTKLQYDLYYIKHRNMYLEISILVKTAAVMIRFRGR